MSKAYTTLAAAFVFAALPAFAQATPPEGAMPLSEIIAAVESRDTIHYINEVEWDDDGYWEIEYFTTDLRKVEVKIDPLTGENI